MSDPDRYRRYRAAHRDEISRRQKQRRAAKKDQIREQSRRYRAANQNKIKAERPRQHAARRHKLTPLAWASRWHAQDGRCYLCGEVMDEGKAVVDHDHRCCQGKNSCWICQRGLAHQDCNLLIGLARDDPQRLRRIADSIEAASLAVAQRMNDATYEQLALGEIA